MDRRSIKLYKALKNRRTITILLVFAVAAMIVAFSAAPVFAAGGNVSTAIQNTWKSAQSQIKSVVNNVVFPVIDMLLAILFFVKLATAYLDYRNHSRIEFTAPAILFACLIFSLTAPSYIWTILS